MTGRHRIWRLLSDQNWDEGEERAVVILPRNSLNISGIKLGSLVCQTSAKGSLICCSLAGRGMEQGSKRGAMLSRSPEPHYLSSNVGKVFP